MKVSELQVGDRVIRMLGGKIPMKMIVIEVNSSTITCVMEPKDELESREKVEALAKMFGMNDDDAEKIASSTPKWTFSTETGGEIDIRLGWNGKITGSYLKFQ